MPEPTIKDISARCGVSFQTVGRILAGKGENFAAATRERVQAVAADLGYRPNRSARAMREGRTGCIALLRGTHPNTSTLPGGLLAGIEAGLRRGGGHLALLTLPDDRLDDAVHLPELIGRWMADGVLVKVDYRIPPGLAAVLARFRIPAIWLNSEQPADAVHPDDRAAGRRAAAELIRLGHRRLGWFDPHADPANEDPAEHYSHRARWLGACDACAAAGLPAPVLPAGAVGLASAERLPFCRAWLSAPERPSAIIAYSAWGGWACCFAARELGLRVPADLSLVTFEEHDPDLPGLELTRLELPLVAEGEAAVDLLQRKIAAPAEPIPTRSLPFAFVLGQSIAPASHP